MSMYGRFNDMVDAILAPPPPQNTDPQALRCADMFSGIGGFHVAANNLGLEVVFACDIDDAARATYRHNFGLEPEGDITRIRAESIPDHDLLFAGFPCQPFSIIGNKQGFADPRGTLWFEVARIIRAKKPQGVVLENVKQLTTADKGKVLQRILDDLEAIGYTVDHRIFNAVNFGLPQKRERTIIVATLTKFEEFPWPAETKPMMPLSGVLEPEPGAKHFVSERIREKRREAHTPAVTPSIWHENKAGHISSYPYSCALRASASHNYLLVNGERRLTPRELLRLQGFPDDFEIISTDSQVRKQAGNAVAVPVVQAIIEGVISVLERSNKITRVSVTA
ncbi:MAG: DNA (cytosine-5-)-methyltransferase [Chloroflexota bacterium]